MSIKNQWATGVACAYILICVACGLPQFTSVGPEGYYFTTESDSIKPISDTVGITDILDQYEFTATGLDCSDKSEIIWYLLNLNGFNATLVGNAGVLNNKIEYHMFVWVNTDNGAIVVDPSFGVIVPPERSLWTQGWVWDSPTEFLKVGNKNDMRGITLDTPIEELPIRKKRPGG